MRQRRTAMGLSVKALAEHAGVDRGRLAVLEEGGNVRLTTVSAVLRALDDLEHEMGMDVPSVVEAPAASDDQPTPGFIRFKVDGVYGARALVVEGPVENIAELEAAVDRILRRMAGEGEGPTEG